MNYETCLNKFYGWMGNWLNAKFGWSFKVPPMVTHIISMLLIMIGMLAFLAVTVIILIWLERKISARIQNRVGPMMAGFKFMGRLSMWAGGWAQVPLDALKLLLKEDIVNNKADRVGFFLAPFICMMSAFMAYMVIPFSRGLVAQDLNIGVLYLVAVSSYMVIAILLAGWSSGNKYSLIGGLRSASQIISYEVPMLFGIITPVMLAGSMSLVDIVEAQKQGWFIIPQVVAFLVFFIAATAEINRTPFDLPEAESELVAGFATEYSGMRFAMFFLAEFSNMFIISAVAATLFLGGWLLPAGLQAQVPTALQLGGFTIPHFDILLGAVVFFFKTYILVALLMWFRWTYPRVRVDQLMGLGWKVLLPVGFINMLLTGFWFLKR